MNRRLASRWVVVLGLLAAVRPAPALAADAAGNDDVMLRAMADELQRSMELQLEDLGRPYFIQFQAEDRTSWQLSAHYGALTANQQARRRVFSSRVRVGGYELDNTNFTAGYRGGTRAVLPIDDDYTALRQAMWSATDREYKRAVETLTRKQAYLEQVNIEDRPDDFSKVEPVQHLDPPAELNWDEQELSQYLKRISARFKQHTAIQDSDASLTGGIVTRYTVNSEGTRLRVSEPGIVLTISADLQADDGMRIGDTRVFGGEAFADLPPEDELLAEVDRMCASLVEVAAASMLEEYTGPILFDGEASGQLFASLLSPGLGDRPDPVGGGRGDSVGLDKKIGKRILPKTFQVYDDPTAKRFDGQLLFGWYEYDDEAVPAQRVDLVANGILQTLVTGRAPTRKIKHSTGHGRASWLGADAQAAVANLFISSNEGLTADEMKQALIEASRDENLEFGLRVTSLDGIGYGGLADPLYIYKVYVEDGREELVRGVEFKPVEFRSLRRIMAAGDKLHVLNHFRDGAGAVVSPAVLFEDLELQKVEEEFDKRPILDSPATRTAEEVPS